MVPDPPPVIATILSLTGEKLVLRSTVGDEDALLEHVPGKSPTGPYCFMMAFQSVDCDTVWNVNTMDQVS